MTRKQSRALFTSLPLDPRSSAPLHRQLYDGIRSAILRGLLPPGTQLPASRALAADLDVSRNTVMAAFDQLLAEGYTEGRHGSGTYVSRSLPEQLLHAGSPGKEARRSAAPRLSERRQALASAPPVFPRSHQTPHAFEVGLPALDEFPVGIWSRLVVRRCRAGFAGLLSYDESTGSRSLREAIAA